MKRTASLLLAVCLALALLTGCGTGGVTDNGQSGDKKTMVIGDTTFNSENWEETVDPHRTYNGWACIRYGIGETLVHYTDSMELEPWLAKSWENDGDLTWTITLRDDVCFSSGRRMDAEAVKQCFEHMLENHDRAPGDTKIAAMYADGQTLTVVTSEPNPALMNCLGDPYGCIIDVDASDFDAGIVAGTGPYVVADMVTDDHLTLTRNENYWAGTPKLDEAKYSSTKNGTATLSFCLAVNRDRKINEQWVSKGSFFYLTVYGKRATGLCKILVKGTRIGVQGFLDQDVWTDAAGKKQYRTVFCVENLVLLGQPKTIPENENHIPEIPSHTENPAAEAQYAEDFYGPETQQNNSGIGGIPENEITDIF